MTQLHERCWVRETCYCREIISAFCDAECKNKTRLIVCCIVIITVVRVIIIGPGHIAAVSGKVKAEHWQCVRKLGHTS